MGEKIGLGKGIGKEAIKILVNHAFLKMNLKKNNGWYVVRKYEGSKKAFEANGFFFRRVQEESSI